MPLLDRRPSRLGRSPLPPRQAGRVMTGRKSPAGGDGRATAYQSQSVLGVDVGVNGAIALLVRRALGRHAGRAARVRHRARLRGPERSRRASPRSGDGGSGGQARSPARGLRAGGGQVDAEPAGTVARRRRRATTRSATTRRRSRRCSSTSSSRRTPRRPSRSSSTSTPPTIRCTAIRKAGSSTATTTATATCRSTCSAAGICWRPSSGRRTSTAAPGRSRRSRASSRRSGRAGRRTRILLRADSGFCPRGADGVVRSRTGSTSCSAWRATRGSSTRSPSNCLQAEAEATATGKPARRFKDFRYSTLDSWSRRRRVIGKAEWTQGEANPRFIVTSLKKAETQRPLPLRGGLLRPRRDGEPHQGMPGRPVRRPHLDGHHARQPAAALVRLVRLCPALRAPAHRPRPHPVRRRDLRHDPAQAPQARRASCASARGASSSPSPRPAPTPTNGAWPPPASPSRLRRRRDADQNRGNHPSAHRRPETARHDPRKRRNGPARLSFRRGKATRQIVSYASGV